MIAMKKTWQAVTAVLAIAAFAIGFVGLGPVLAQTTTNPSVGGAGTNLSGTGITGTLAVTNGGTGTTTSTGSGSVVLGTSPTITTPNLVGTTAAGNASAGSVGEYVESVVATVSFPTSTQYGDAASISLTAGDWDVTGQGVATVNGATVVTWRMGISTTSGNASTGLVAGSNLTGAILPPTSTADAFASIPAYRINVSGTTTVYLKFLGNFSVATPQISGRLSARRIR